MRGGGGRSFGGGGNRSFGGRAGGGLSGGRGGSSGLGSRGGSLGGLGGAHRPRRTHIHLSPFAFGGWGWGRRRGVVHHHHHGSGGCGGCAGFSSLFAVILVLLVILLVIFAVQDFIPGSGGSGGVTRSTVQREALPRGSVVETGYYTDELNWIQNRTTLTAGMRNFYQRTGVQPYLYITDNINGSASPSVSEAEAFAQALYDELFQDEAHLLVIFFEPRPSYYHTWYLAGRQAKAVLDDEAMDILLDYIDRYYYHDRYNEEQFFSMAFDDASKRIMAVTRSPWIPVMTFGILALIGFLAFTWWKKHKEQKNREAEQNERILNSSLDTFGGDDAAADLAKKYEENVYNDPEKAKEMVKKYNELKSNNLSNNNNDNKEGGEK
jgi:uncharacterized membrane protein